MNYVSCLHTLDAEEEEMEAYEAKSQKARERLGAFRTELKLDNKTYTQS
jgi:hypothetical protein